MFGTGYVGLVTGTCFAEMGNNVVCIDVDKQKVDDLKAGKLPIFEPGLEQMLLRNLETGRLAFSTDSAHGVNHGELLFLSLIHI